MISLCSGDTIKWLKGIKKQWGALSYFEAASVSFGCVSLQLHCLGPNMNPGDADTERAVKALASRGA